MKLSLLALSFFSVVIAVHPADIARATPAESSAYDVQNYSIKTSIDPRIESPQLEAETQVRLRMLIPSETLEFDAVDLKVSAVQIRAPLQKRAEYRQENGKLIVTLPKRLAARQTVVLEIRHSLPVQQRQLGLFRVKDPDDAGRGWLYFTQFEPTGARHVFPCHDVPSDKATTQVRIQVPEGYAAVSNGRKAIDRKFRRAGEGWREILWHMDQPHSTYLVSLAVGKFDTLSLKRSSPPIRFWVGSGREKATDFAMTSTAETLKFFENYLATPFPWPKYDTIGLPTFIWGGMENTSATHMNQERILLIDPSSATLKRRIYALVAHEAAHQWFGDSVTMRDWEDLWLNEAFASYLATLAVGAKFGTLESSLLATLQLWDEYFRQENGPRSRPLVDKKLDSPEDAFDAVAYTKGEAVLRMLSHQIGEASFRKGLKSYLQKYRYQNADYRDFFAAMQLHTKENLTGFRDSWLLQRGYPIVSYRSEWDPTAKKLTLRVSQKSNHSGDGSLFHFRLPVTLHRRTQPEFHRSISVPMTTAEAETSVELPAEPEWLSVNTGAPILADVRDGSKATTPLLLQAASDPDPHARVWALHQLMTPLREGKELSRPVSDAIATAMSSDPSPQVRIALIQVLQKLQTRWLPPDIGATVLTLATQAGANGFTASPLVLSEPHGWMQWRARILGLLGKVKDPKALPLLTKLLSDPKLGLDDLAESADAVATLGASESVAVLKQAIQTHGPRGYRYRFELELAFGALERTEAARYIRDLAQTARPDLLGKIGWTIRDNTVLRDASEWANTLRELILENQKIDIDVKVRLLSSVEEVKTPQIKKLLEAIVERSPGARLVDAARKALSKNFGVAS